MFCVQKEEIHKATNFQEQLNFRIAYFKVFKVLLIKNREEVCRQSFHYCVFTIVFWAHVPVSHSVFISSMTENKILYRNTYPIDKLPADNTLSP